MNTFLRKHLAPPVMLAGILAFGATFAWIAVVATLTSMLAPVFYPTLGDISEKSPQFAWMMGALLLSPLLVGTVLFGWIPLVEMSRRVGIPHWRFDWSELSHFWAPTIAVCTLAAILAIYFYRRHRRFSDRGALGWAIFIFIWGVPGVVGYLLHRHWPTTEVCRNCGKASPRDRDACLHCNTAFPPPAMKGIEIFA